MRSAGLLLAAIFDVVVGNLIGREHKRHAIAHVVHIFRRVADSLAGITRLRNLLYHAFAMTVEGDVEGRIVLAVRKACVASDLHPNYLAIRVVLARLFKSLLL